ncbi:MAG: cytochrome c3 family protein [Chloroflexi bacterium]|nr:cytochrome c3 family protein [Chloroflexota bacterium]MCI0578549.1 cytochrome c3 family protein [Chloroflexota bacterium]MCI0647455.1 cytochrome c3 family protein [Chloroflexota bacterium]MCI0731124.1 cytochrome c3 family protein [Chloroflexota bacterium]
MMRRSSPLYSPLGCGAAVLLLLVLGAILYFRGGGPFSPGPLTAASPQNVPLADFGSHAEFEGECSRCHQPWRGVSAGRCEACHENVAQQRDSGAGLHGRLPDTGRCQSCHTDHQGREANITLLALANFEHDRLTNFSLARHEEDYDGSAVACEECHRENEFTVAAVECVSCHTAAEPAFMADHTTFFGDDCLACHDGRDTMAAFEHDQVFALDGAHASVECAACHPQPVLAGTPRDCAGCHEEPAVHAGLFGADCVRCHTTAAWTPAQLTRHTFPLDHGGEGQIPCQSCHIERYTEYTCTNCHAHDPAETREKHLEEGISDFADCVACHPTGLEDEAEREEDDD